jgi:hypothetical protein
MYLKKVLAIGVCVVLLSTPLLAIFGIGMPVFDASALVEMLVQSENQREQIMKAIQTYNKLADQYNHAVRQAQGLTGGKMSRYRSTLGLFRQFVASDLYNKNADWVKTANTGIGGADAWNKLGVARIPYSDIGKLPQGQQDRAKKEVAAIELQDGAGVNTLEVIGSVRQVGPQRELILAELENDAFSTDPDLQTDAAKQNLANALLVFQAKQTQDQIRLMTNLLEMNLLRARQERDAQAYAVNEAAYAVERRGFYMTDTQGGPSQAMREFSVSVR